MMGRLLLLALLGVVAAWTPPRLSTQLIRRFNAYDYSQADDLPSRGARREFWAGIEEDILALDHDRVRRREPPSPPSPLREQGEKVAKECFLD